MIVMLDSVCWIHDDDLARLADDGCPNLQPETGRMECMECCGTHMVGHWENYTFYTYCPDCGTEGHDHAEDMYGCMAVPWGFLL